MQERLHLQGPPPRLLDLRTWGFQASTPRKPQEARPGGGACQPKRGSGLGRGRGGARVAWVFQPSLESELLEG